MPPHTRPKPGRPLPLAVSAILAGVVAATAPARAETVEGIVALEDRPIAPLGGVLMVPLGARRPGDGWPVTLDLVTGDGGGIAGRVVWIEPVPPGPIRTTTWTAEPAPLHVRPVRPDDDSRRADRGGPWLLARLPAQPAGSITLGEQTLRPVWRDAGRAYTFDGLPGLDRPVLARTDSPDRPDPDAPFAYWRWVLLADALDHRPPPLDALGDPGALVAEHQAQVWRIALGHLAEHSLLAATTCRDHLTRICTDRPHRFAGWVADPGALEELLTTLLDFRRSGPDLVSDALAWAETRRALAAWTEEDVGDVVTVALLNRGFSLLVARLTWEGTGRDPVLVELPPGSLTRERIRRPPVAGLPTVGLYARTDPDVQRLSIKAGRDVLHLAFGPRAAPVRPPGVLLPPFRRPLTLAELDAQQLAGVPLDHATTVHLRKLHGRWEAFLDCRRPGGADAVTGSRDAAYPADPADPLGAFAAADDVRGVEAVTLLFGGLDEPAAVLVVPERGAPRVFVGPAAEAPAVHRRSYGDRWYCRVVLPEAWLGAGPERPTLIGARRTHAGGDAVESTPNTGPPWRFRSSRIAVDLSRWDEGR